MQIIYITFHIIYLHCDLKNAHMQLWKFMLCILIYKKITYIHILNSPYPPCMTNIPKEYERKTEKSMTKFTRSWVIYSTAYSTVLMHSTKWIAWYSQHPKFVCQWYSILSATWNNNMCYKGRRGTKCKSTLYNTARHCKSAFNYEQLNYWYLYETAYQQRKITRIDMLI
jgi:hypothetical protein